MCGDRLQSVCVCVCVCVCMCWFVCCEHDNLLFRDHTIYPKYNNNYIIHLRIILLLDEESNVSL